MRKKQKQLISLLIIVMSVLTGANAQDSTTSGQSPQVKLRTVLKLPKNGEQPQLSAAVDVKKDEWKILVGRTWQKPSSIELAVSCISDSISTGIGTLYASGLPRLTENPFSLSYVAGSRKLPSFSVSKFPFSPDLTAGMSPGGFVSFKVGQVGGEEKISINLYGVPPGYNDLTSFRIGLFAGVTRDARSIDGNLRNGGAAAEETFQIGIVRHGLLEPARNDGESGSVYQQNTFGRTASQDGFTTALGVYRETRTGGSGITLLASFDSAGAPGTAISGLVHGALGSISFDYMQIIYSDAYPILFGKTSTAVSAQHAGSAVLTIPKLMELSLAVEEVLYLFNQYITPEELASRTYTASLLLTHSPIEICVKDSLSYHYSTEAYSISAARTFDVSGKLTKGPLELSVYTNHQTDNWKTDSARHGGAVKMTGTSTVLRFWIDVTTSDRDAGVEIAVKLPSAKLTVSGDVDGNVKAVFRATL